MAITKTDTIGIKTLSLNYPEEFSQHGSLEKLHNLRYKNGAVENVSNFAISDPITNFNNFELLYIHKDNYIAINEQRAIHHVTKEMGKLISQKELTDELNDDATIKISHYGNILYITLQSEQFTYLLKDGIYTSLSLDQLKPINNIEFEYTFFTTPNYGNINGVPITGYSDTIAQNDEFSLAIDDMEEQGYIFGVTYVMFAYKLFDGSIIKNSRAYMIETEQAIRSADMDLVTRHESLEMIDTNTYNYVYTQILSGSKPSVTIKIDSDTINTDFVKSIVVFATRPTNIYDFSNYHSIFESELDNLFESTNKINASKFRISDLEECIQRPFYEIDEFDLSTISNDTISFDLTYNKHFDDIEYKPLYEASFSAHNTQHLDMYEYNGLLHTFHQKVDFCYPYPAVCKDDTFYNGYTAFHKSQLPSGYKIEFYVELTVDDSTIEIGGDYIEYLYTDTTSVSSAESFFLPLSNFISYPDYRAQKINIYYSHNQQRMLILSIPLKEAPSNNLAYNTRLTNRLVAASYLVSIKSPSNFTPTNSAHTTNKRIEQRNKIMVSTINNPFVFMPINSYQIGDSDTTIHKIATAADEIRENSYGQHPLIVFTSSGIYALEQGKENTLYSNIIYISNSPIDSSIESISLSGNLLFTSNGKVYSLKGRNIISISDSITISPARTNHQEETLADYIAMGTFFVLSWYNEILLYNESYNYGYVYSIDNGSWYSRSIIGHKLSSTSIVNNQGVIDLSRRENKTSSLPPSLITNSLCFATSALTKIEYIKPIYKATKNLLTSITIYASNDHTTWYKVSTTIQHQKIGRISSSWRYFKIEISCSSTNNEALYFILASLQIKHTTKYNPVVD